MCFFPQSNPVLPRPSCPEYITTEMTSNDVFDVISVDICLPTRRAEDYKPLVLQMCKPINKK